MTGWLLFGEFFAVAGAFIAGRMHTDEFVLHCLARMRGAQRFLKRRRCPGCGFEVHVMRLSKIALDGGETDGYLCVPCASGRHR